MLFHQMCEYRSKLVTKMVKITPTNLRCEYLHRPLAIDLLNPQLSWELLNEDKNAKALFQSAYRIFAASTPELLTAENADIWDTGKVISDQTAHITYTGKPLISHQNIFWKVLVWNQDDSPSDWSDCPIGYWRTGFLNGDKWLAAWIGAEITPKKMIQVQSKTKPIPTKIFESHPSPLIRKDFLIEEPVKSAFLYATALGEYELRLNGQRVSDQYYSPEWTDFSKRVQYQIYDVQTQINEGVNCLGVILGDGWYLGLLGPGDQVRQNFYGDHRQVRIYLRIITQSGKIIHICSDETWKYTEEGPIRSSDHFIGETFDARKEIIGWDSPDFADHKWKNAKTFENPQIHLVSQQNEPVRLLETLTPQDISQLPTGEIIVNFGQNLVGWTELKIEADDGDEIAVYHGEMLEENGSLYTDNLRLASQIDRYIMDGSSCRVFHPHFTFHGFQYAEIHGLRSKDALVSIKALATWSSSPQCSEFRCSNPMVNKIWQNTLWGFRGNAQSVPTDCPQRDERMGWTGDSQVFAQTGMYLMDTAAFYRKHIVDLRDGQLETGEYCDFVPYPIKKKKFNFGPGWADAGVIIPWHHYVTYGDRRLIQEHYKSMKKYVDLIIERNPNYIWKNWHSNYGDWLNGRTFKAKDYPKKRAALDKTVYATLFYYHSASLLAKMGAVLNKLEEAEYYKSIALKVSEKFKSKFVKSSGRIKGNTQSGYAIALHFGILPERFQKKAAKLLVKRLEQFDNRLSTGFIGTLPMLKTLTKWGFSNLAYSLVESTRFPSWGYSIEQGATTIWERWDAYIAGRGFQNKGMNSFNHYSFGAVVEWMYRVILGINFDETNPAMKGIILSPIPGGSLTYVVGSYSSMHGKIVSSWKKELGNIIYHFEIPVNTRAKVILKTPKSEIFGEGNQSLGNLSFISDLVYGSQKISFTIGSGSYNFTVPQ